MGGSEVGDEHGGEGWRLNMNLNLIELS